MCVCVCVCVCDCFLILCVCVLLFHHVLYYHALTDKLKDAVIAKIAMQAADLYADAYSNMQVGSVKQMWDKVCTDIH